MELDAAVWEEGKCSKCVCETNQTFPLTGTGSVRLSSTRFFAFLLLKSGSWWLEPISVPLLRFQAC